MKTCRKGLHQYAPIKGSHRGCPYCTKNRSAVWAKNNKNRYKASVKCWYQNNKIRHRQRIVAWFKENPEKQALYSAERKARQLLATPSWLSTQQLNEIKEFYSLAKELSWLSESPLEVDHIVPLQGKEVRGLHVPWNLQILPENLNCKKGNRV